LTPAVTVLFCRRYAAFPGAKGKTCCDKSYARRAQGSMPNDERMSELAACTSKK